MRSVSVGVSVALALAAVLSSEAAVQAAPAQRGNAGQQPSAAQASGVVAMSAISFSVSDLARSVAFYRTAFGLEMFGATVPAASMNSAMASLVSAGGAKYRQATFEVPHTGVVVRLMEFSGVERASHKPGLGDPGQVRPRFLVSNMEVALASLKLAGADIVWSGGESGASKTPTQVVARDPDGYVIKIEREDDVRAVAVTDLTPVVGLHVELTTADTARKLAFYKDVLGIDLAAGAPGTTQTGAGDLKRTASGELGGANRLLDIVEYREAGHAAPARGRVADPATGVVSFIVRDLDAALNAARQAKLRVVTAGEAPVSLAYAQARRIVVQDPDGAYVEMVEP